MKAWIKSKKALIIIGIVILLVSIFPVIKMIERQNIRNEITSYLSDEHGLENIKITFVEPRLDVYEYGVEVYASNLNSYSYEQMTQFESYTISHTELDYCDVVINRYLCGEDSYIIYPNSVYKNGKCVYEVKKKPSSSVTSADAPFVGMDDEFIGSTKLGQPDKKEYCLDYGSLIPEKQSITYKWYDYNGKMIYYAFAINGKVTSVTDYRK